MSEFNLNHFDVLNFCSFYNRLTADSIIYDDNNERCCAMCYCTDGVTEHVSQQIFLETLHRGRISSVMETEAESNPGPTSPSSHFPSSSSSSSSSPPPP